MSLLSCSSIYLSLCHSEKYNKEKQVHWSFCSSSSSSSIRITVDITTTTITPTTTTNSVIVVTMWMKKKMVMMLMLMLMIKLILIAITVFHFPMMLQEYLRYMDALQKYQWSSSFTYEPRHDKTNKVTVRPAKTQISDDADDDADDKTNFNSNNSISFPDDVTGIFKVYGCTTEISMEQLLYIWAATWQNQQSDCAPSEDSDQPGRRMPRLIWVFAGRTVTLLVLSCRGSYRSHS